MHNNSFIKLSLTRLTICNFPLTIQKIYLHYLTTYLGKTFYEILIFFINFIKLFTKTVGYSFILVIISDGNKGENLMPTILNNLVILLVYNNIYIVYIGYNHNLCIKVIKDKTL